MSVVMIANEDEFKKFLSDNSGKMAVIDFFATWCGPCKMIAPKIAAMAKELDNVVFGKVDVDENEDLAQEYEISAMPTFVFFKGGKKIGAFQGANEQKLREKIDELK